MKNLKKAFSLGLVAIFFGCSTPSSSLTWTTPSVVSAFMTSCNPSNDPAMKTVCECVIEKFKVSHPDASKADSIPQSVIESTTKECIK